jgi:hypothetical protein
MVPINLRLLGFRPDIQKNRTNNKGPKAIKTDDKPEGIVKPAKAMQPLPNVINKTPARRCTFQCSKDNVFQCPPKIDQAKKSTPATKFLEKDITKGGK